MKIREITDSPGYYITEYGEVYNKEFYHGGYTFSFKELLNFTNNVSSKKALKDRNIIWDKLINKCYVCKQRRAQASDVKS